MHDLDLQSKPQGHKKVKTSVSKFSISFNIWSACYLNLLYDESDAYLILSVLFKGENLT